MGKLGQSITLWTALLFFPFSSWGLGLGEIEVDSFLNQPLKAEIKVVAFRPGEVDDLLVSLASRDAFRKAGLERAIELSDLRFKVEKSADGESAKILVTTRKAVKEPFLNFLLEADWAKGRLLREFTILLDPPYFAQQEAPAAAAPVSEPAPVSQPQATPAPAAEADSYTPIVDSPTAEPEPVTQQEEYIQPIAMEEAEAEQADSSIPYVDDKAYLENEDEIGVQKGDTLWSIASRYNDGTYSMAQIMLALQATNPDAFGRDNINNLKVGAVLRAPQQFELDRLSKQEAYAQVLEQNGLWDDYVARVSGATSSGSPEAVADGSAQSDSGQDTGGQLSLLAPGDGESESGALQSQGDSGDSNQLRKQLALAEEELEAARLENDDLQSRIGALEEQINKYEELQKLVEIEDSALAQLQNQPESDQSAATGTVSDEPSQVMIEAAEDMMADQADSQPASEQTEMPVPTVSEETPVEVVEETADQMAEETTATDSMIDDLPQTESETVADSADSMEQMPPAPIVQEEVIPAPVIVTESDDVASDSPDSMIPPVGDMLSDPVMLGGVGAILALLIGLLFLRRKKSDDSDEGITLEGPEDSLVDDDATPIHVPTSEEVEGAPAEETVEEELVDTASMQAETMQIEDAQDGDEEDEFSKTAVISADEMPEAEEAPASAAEQDDVLNEVDVYLAYGLYDNAEELLSESIESSPDRADYRAKMLDTHFATKNKDSFVKEAEALRSLGGAADRYWDRVQIMGYELAPDNDLFAEAKDIELSVSDLEYAKPDSADFDIGADDDITDFSNTDFDLGSEETFELPETDASDEDVEADDLELDALELEEAPEVETRVSEDDESVEVDEALPDEIGELDMDFGEVEADDANVDEDALDFDLPDDLDLSVQTGQMAPAVESEDDGLIDLEETLTVNDADIELNDEPNEEDDAVELELDESLGEELEVAQDEVADLVDLETDDSEFDATQIVDAEEVDSLEPDIELDESDEEESLKTQVVSTEEEGTMHVDSALDVDMSDLDAVELHTGTFQPAEELPADDITEFKPADVTGEFEAADFELDEVVEEVDAGAGIEKTGTFAPGDFDDEEGDSAVADLDDDIEGLMLPDDVDEVGTKLDLAKAFIDMGDAEGARTSLEEVLSEGTQEQKAEATGLLEQIK